MTAQDKISQIKQWLNTGKTVYISTATRTTKITPKTYANWEKSGHELLKASGDSMYMASGRNFVCIDYCKIQAA